VFEKRVLRKKFGQRSYEMTGGWRKPNGNELDDLYSLQG
jgi:hypothetical protein